MKVLINTEAAKSIRAVMKFIESQNTRGSGLRWFRKLEQYLLNILPSTKSISRCKYPPFREKKLNCLVYKDWIIAFRNSAEYCEIVAFVYGRNLDY